MKKVRMQKGTAVISVPEKNIENWKKLGYVVVENASGKEK